MTTDPRSREPPAPLKRRRALLTGGQPRPPRRTLLRARGKTQGRLRVFRTIAGWALIVLGIVGLLLPILQGFLFLSAGVAVLGRRSLLVRWFRVRIRLLERRFLADPGVRGRLARWSKEKRLALEHRRRDRALRRHGPGTEFATPPRDPERSAP
jgi:hypothetical protein